MEVGDILVAKGIVSRDDCQTALQESRKRGGDLISALAEHDEYSADDMIVALAEHYELPLIDLRATAIPAAAIQAVPAKFARHYGIVPVSTEGGVLTVAVSDPCDPWVVDDLQTSVGMRVHRVLALPAQVREAIEHHYGVGADTIERILDEDEASGQTTVIIGAAGPVEDIERLAGDASVVRLVNEIIQQAVSERATDIHLESFPDEAKLRYRIDGILRDARVSEDVRYLYPAIISRIKIMSGLDIIERRIPQDGRAKVKAGRLEYDLRISVMPTINGENIVIRILPTTMLFSLAELGMYDEDLKTMDSLIHQPNGVIFVTGPTGSGKSTTLYASLKSLNNADIKLVTIEDPVEYALRGVSQVQVNPRTGLTFALALRSMLRHDPDVIMVGEIRDLETANIATRAALTGHLVLSTVHTNSAAGGAARLVDIGIEPYLIASSVLAFIGQRLVRKVCTQCSQTYELDDEVLMRFGRTGESLHASRGIGCDACGQTGYRGRTGIYEILRVDGKIRELILEKSSADAIRREARKLGIKSMLDDGFHKILDGKTTPEEVLRVTQAED